jgi:hypothetical protein
VLRCLEDLPRRTLLDDHALVEEDHPIRDRPRESHLVGDADHRHAGVSGQRLHDIEHLADHLRIEGRRRLVEEHDLRVHGESACDRDALLLAARQLRGVLVCLLGDADAREQLHASRFRIGARGPPHSHGRQDDVLERGEVREQVERLEHHADLAADGGDVADVVGELDAVDDDLAALVLLEAVDRADEGRLARARRAEDDDHLAGLHREVDAAQHVELVEPLVDVSADDDVVGVRIGPALVGHQRTPTPSWRSSR